MKKVKKIGLSLNKKIVSNLQANEITGGDSRGSRVVGGCYAGYGSNLCSDPRMTTYDCNGKM